MIAEPEGHRGRRTSRDERTTDPEEGNGKPQGRQISGGRPGQTTSRDDQCSDGERPAEAKAVDETSAHRGGDDVDQLPGTESQAHGAPAQPQVGPDLGNHGGERGSHHTEAEVDAGHAAKDHPPIGVSVTTFH